MIAEDSYIKGARVNVLGLTFKENCADPQEAMHEYGVRLSTWDELPRADAVLAAVSHRALLALTVEDFQKKLVKGGCFIDVKACFDAAALEATGIRVWRL